MNILDHTASLKNYMEFRNYSECSVKNYCSNFSGFLSYFEKRGISHPEHISAEMIIDFLKTFKEPSTHSGYHSSIKLYYQKVSKRGTEKFKFLERPKKNKTLPIILSQSEVQDLITQATNLKHKTIICVMYSTGVRVSELLNIKLKDIDRKNMVIHVTNGKGGKQRQVVLRQEILELIEKYWRAYKTKDYLFEGQRGGEYSSRSINEFLKMYALKAGINKKIHAHLIRHCTGTHLTEAGVNLGLIQRSFGHSNPKTTMIYQHISPNLIANMYSPIQGIRI